MLGLALLGLIALIASIGAYWMIGGRDEGPNMDQVAGLYASDKDKTSCFFTATGDCFFHPDQSLLHGATLYRPWVRLRYAIDGNAVHFRFPPDRDCSDWPEARRQFIQTCCDVSQKVEQNAIVSSQIGRLVRTDGAPVRTVGTARSRPAHDHRVITRCMFHYDVAISADGSLAVSGGSEDVEANGYVGGVCEDFSNIDVWDPAKGTRIAQWQTNIALQKYARFVLSADGNRLAIGCGHYARIMNPRAGEFFGLPLDCFGENDYGQINPLTFSPDGKRAIFVTVPETGAGQLIVLDADTGREKWHAPVSGAVVAVAPLADNKSFIALVRSQNQSADWEIDDVPTSLRWMDLESGAVRQNFDLPRGWTYRGLALKSDQKLLAIAAAARNGDQVNYVFEIRDATNGALAKRLEKIPYAAQAEACQLSFGKGDATLFDATDAVNFSRALSVDLASGVVTELPPAGRRIVLSSVAGRAVSLQMTDDDADSLPADDIRHTTNVRFHDLTAAPK